jgi:multiple sugar transport system substrate-binding protein
MRANNLIPDPETGVEFSGATLDETMFSRDMVLMANAPVNQFAMQRETFPDKDMTIIRNPSLPGAPVGEFPEGAHFGISAHSPPEQQRAAALLMNYWLNTGEALNLFRLDQGVPGNESLHYVFIDELTEDQVSILEYVQYCSTFAWPFNFHPRGAGEVNSSFVLHAELVSFGMMSPEDAAQAFYDEAREIVASHRDE